MHSFLAVPHRDIDRDRYFIITFCSPIISASSLWMVSLNLLTLFVNFCRWSRLYSSWTFNRVFWFSNSTLVKVQYFKPTLTKQASNCDFKLLQDTKNAILTVKVKNFYLNTKICIHLDHQLHYTTSCGYTGSYKNKVIIV